MRREWIEVVGVLLGLLLVLVVAQFWSQAVFAAPILLGLAALPSTVLRILRRAEGLRLAQRLSGAAVWLAVAAVLVDAVPAGRLFIGPRPVVLGVYIAVCVLLALRAFLLPGRHLPVARSVVASLLAVGLLAGQVHGHVAGPGGRDAVTATSPVVGEWFALQAGRNPATNHHRLIRSQAFAADLVQVVDGRTYHGPRERLASYAAYDEPVTAPVAGRVVHVVRDLEDSQIGDRDPEHPAGNHVVIELRRGIYVLLAHLKSGSVEVRTGQAVQAGDLLGRIGNSGNSSEPHLHLQAMTRVSLDDPNVRSLPLLLTDVVHIRGGHRLGEQPDELRRNDLFRAAAR